MTVEQIKALDDHALCMKVAELDGWHHIEQMGPCDHSVALLKPNTWVGRARGQSSRGWRHPIPNYVMDLNAMYEAERSLDEHQRYLFCKAIACSKYKLDDLWDCTHATARTRARAFVAAKLGVGDEH